MYIAPANAGLPTICRSAAVCQYAQQMAVAEVGVVRDTQTRKHSVTASQ
jgi:hypothetical protein